jgi:hypothetical protein
MFVDPFATVNSLWAYAGFVSALHFWDSPWSFEQRAGLTFATRPYAVAYDAPYDASDDKPRTLRQPYVVYAVDVLPLVELSESWSAGTLAGVAWGYPLLAADSDRFDGVDFMLTGGPLVRYGVTPGVAVEFLLRFNWLEELTVFHSDLRGATTMETKGFEGLGELLPREMMAGVGLRFGTR